MYRQFGLGMAQVKALLVVVAFYGSLLSASAQQKFSPEKYQADLEQFITKEACLTPQEAAAFFPLFREMQNKQRSLYSQMRTEGMIKPADEEACKKMIQKRDQVELDLKIMQQTYHNKFLSVIPASKVFSVIWAEDRFHRRMFRNWGNGPGGPQNNKRHQR